MNEQSTNADKSAIVTFDYEGSMVSFLNGKNVMVNATDMARKFGKNVRQWFDNPSTHEFIEALAVARGYAPTAKKRTSLNTSVLAKQYPQLVKVVKGGIVGQVTQGTWINQDVALEFARWLSPEFAIWTNDRIKELLTQGVATISNDDDIIAQAMHVLQRRLDEKTQRLQMVESTVEAQEKEIKKLAPAAEYTHNVLQSDSTYTFTQVAKDLGMRSARMLIKFLYQNHIIFRQSEQWLPTAKYSQSGFFDTRTAQYFRSDNSIGTSLSTVITEKGRLFLHKFFNQKIQKSQKA